MSNVAAELSAVSGTCVQVEGWEVLVGDEPRVRDADLAERVGMTQPRNVRQVIAKHRVELEAHGALDYRARRARQSTGNGGSREIDVSEYWLNEPQALALVAHLRTPKALELRIALVKLFVAVRRGMTPSVAPATPPAPRVAEVDRVLLRLDALSRAAARASLLPAAPRHGSVLAALGRLLADAHTVACDVDAVDARHYLEEASHALVVQLRIWRREEAARAVRLAASAAQ